MGWFICYIAILCISLGFLLGVVFHSKYSSGILARTRSKDISGQMCQNCGFSDLKIVDERIMCSNCGMVFDSEETRTKQAIIETRERIQDRINNIDYAAALMNTRSSLESIKQLKMQMAECCCDMNRTIITDEINWRSHPYIKPFQTPNDLRIECGLSPIKGGYYEC